MIKDKIFNTGLNKPRILVAPLDWGLGHATRCIPIIFKLLQQNCEVIIAAEAAGKFLLEKEFPGLTFIDLKGYRIQYSRNKIAMPVKMLLQFPGLLYSIYTEQQWLKKIIKTHKIDAVIADNRLGLYHTDIPCIYITHQLQIKTGNLFTERLAQKIHYYFINKYKTCWLPDAAGETNLAGELSHPAVLPKAPVVYIGPLSRLQKKQVVLKYDCCILLSGPEPQRTVFEKIILKELNNFSGTVFFLRGLPGNTTVNELTGSNIEIKNHLPADELSIALQQSKIVICRSGYTTIMDLVKLQKPAILVPTPGQTEQEYLANYLQQQQLFKFVEQQNFSLEVLKDTIPFDCNKSFIEQNSYEKVIEDFVKQHLKIN